MGRIQRFAFLGSLVLRYRALRFLRITYYLPGGQRSFCCNGSFSFMRLPIFVFLALWFWSWCSCCEIHRLMAIRKKERYLDYLLLLDNALESALIPMITFLISPRSSMMSCDCSVSSVVGVLRSCVRGFVFRVF